MRDIIDGIQKGMRGIWEAPGASALAFALLLALPAFAAVDRSQPAVSDYELDSTSYIYCGAYSAANSTADFWGMGMPVNQPVTTSGSSTTVTAVNNTEAPFDNLVAGDELVFNLDGVIEKRYVSAVASDISMTINSAINLSAGARGTAGYGFFWRRSSCGTTASSGWVPVRGQGPVTFTLVIDQMNATSIDAKLECRIRGSVSSPVTYWTENYTAAGGDAVIVESQADECRMGLKINTDDGSDTGADAEKITINVAANSR